MWMLAIIQSIPSHLIYRDVVLVSKVSISRHFSTSWSCLGHEEEGLERR